MGCPFVIRYSLLRKPGPWKVQPAEETRDDLHDWYKGYQIRKVGLVTVHDEIDWDEKELAVYECRVTMGLFHQNAEERAIRNSRVITSYIVYLKGLPMRYVPEHHKMGCEHCLEEPSHPEMNRMCQQCSKVKYPVVSLTSCRTSDPGLFQAFTPQMLNVLATWNSRPYKEELIMKTMNPERPNFLASVLDIGELKDFHG